MARRSNSMRVRRRQSDAKWRASVANCYTTLKIITSTSSSKKKSKRKFSKAHILQETVNYISHLEAMLTTFLNEKDKMIQNGSLPNTSHSILMIEQVKQEFSAKQADIFTSGMTMRKCSSSLHDLLNEAFEADSTGSLTAAAKINETPVLENKSIEEPETDFSESSQIFNKWKLDTENETPDVLPTVFSPFKEIKFNYYPDLEFNSSMSSSNVCKLKSSNETNPFSRDPLKTEIKIEDVDLFATPKKLTEFPEKKSKDNQPTSGSRLLIRQLPGGSSLFTPLKSPPVFDLCLSPIATPYRMQLSNYLPSSFLFSTPENEPAKTLTCQESVDVPDSVTPSSKSSKINTSKNNKHGTTCRKRLDKLFIEPKTERDSSFDLGMPDITDDDSLDFDGYFLFYKQFVEELKHQSGSNAESLDNRDLARKVSRMWSTLPADQKTMIMAMAALEKKQSHNMKLTDDLRNLDVKRVLDIDDIDDAQLFSKNTDHMSQVVPEMNFNQPHQYSTTAAAATATCSSSDYNANVSSFSQCLVPEYNPNLQTGSMDLCCNPFTLTSNSLSDQYYWKGSNPLVNQQFKMENAMEISYEIIDIQSADNMDFDAVAAAAGAATNMKTECDDGQLVPIWDSL